MNPHILFVIDHLANPEKYTLDELKSSRESAWAAYHASRKSAAYAAAATVDAATATTTYWINEYFNITGENKQDYIDAINKDNKQ